MNINVQINDDQLLDIKRQAKQEIISDIMNGDISVLSRLSHTMSLANFIDHYGIKERAQELSTRRVGDLTGEEEFLLMIYWMTREH